ncbi:MAG TPA: DUF397 domain-containing protein [Trebonia sp.]|nr:DUF397 domain-containing protein [Trebonia sp.]
MNTRDNKVDLMQSAGELSSEWRKSSFSGYNTNCVEVAGFSGGMILVRDSKNPRGGVLDFATGEWDAFIGGVRNGEFGRKPGNL